MDSGNFFANILMIVFFIIFIPLLIIIFLGGVLFEDSASWVLMSYYIMTNLILWGILFTGVWYFVFSAGFLSYILITILFNWGEISYWSDSLHFAF